MTPDPNARGPDAPPPRVSTGADSKAIYVANMDAQEGSSVIDLRHDPRTCATCAITTWWDPSLRDALELRAWLAGRRRICDLPEVA